MDFHPTETVEPNTPRARRRSRLRSRRCVRSRDCGARSWSTFASMVTDGAPRRPLGAISHPAAHGPARAPALVEAARGLTPMNQPTAIIIARGLIAKRSALPHRKATCSASTEGVAAWRFCIGIFGVQRPRRTGLEASPDVSPELHYLASACRSESMEDKSNDNNH